MSREEALNDWLPIIRQMVKGTEVYTEALDMAIKALEQEPCDDAVSRQAAINAAIDGADKWDGGFNREREKCIQEEIEKLPSVTPQPCEDCVSRQAVLDGLVSIAKAKAKSDKQKSLMGRVIFFVEQVPSVTPQQKVDSSSENPNKWIPITSRPMTEEEKEDFAERTGYDEKDFDDILSCPLPEDGETVLITDRLGNVEVDTFINDCDGCYFECNCDMEDVEAWMPLPQPYQSAIPTEAEGSE